MASGANAGNARSAAPGGKMEQTWSEGPGGGGPPTARAEDGVPMNVEGPQARKKYASRWMARGGRVNSS